MFCGIIIVCDWIAFLNGKQGDGVKLLVQLYCNNRTSIMIVRNSLCLLDLILLGFLIIIIFLFKET